MSNQELKTVQQESLPVAQVSETGALMTVIERISTMPDLDMDRVERLFQMHEKMLDRQAETEYNQAMAMAQSEISTVIKNRVNKHTGSKYADIGAIHDKAKPIWTKHGLSVSSGTCEARKDGYVGVFCEVMHSAGFKKRYEDEFPLDGAGMKGGSNKAPIQAMGSTITYARRYMESMIFDIAVGDDNDGSPKVETISESVAKIVKAKLQRTGTDVRRFLDAAGAKDVDSMTPSQYSKVSAGLDAKDKKLSENDNS